jgi:hypothetical protein
MNNFLDSTSEKILSAVRTLKDKHKISFKFLGNIIFSTLGNRHHFKRRLNGFTRSEILQFRTPIPSWHDRSGKHQGGSEFPG